MKRRYQTLIAFLKSTPEGQRRIDRLYESYATEIKRRRKESHKNFE
jgi:hypothetical protein